MAKTQLPAGFRLIRVRPGDYRVVLEEAVTTKAFIYRHANGSEWVLGFEPGAPSGVYQTLSDAVDGAIKTLQMEKTDLSVDSLSRSLELMQL